MFSDLNIRSPELVRGLGRLRLASVCGTALMKGSEVRFVLQTPYQLTAVKSPLASFEQ